MRNERGGVLSKLVVLPLGVAFMVGFFFLGYYVGKYQSKSGVQIDTLPPLPEAAKPYIPKAEEFTFYKTLTEKEDRTVSLDLRPKAPETVKSAPPGKDPEPPARKEAAERPRKQEPAAEMKKSKPAPTPLPAPASVQRFTVQVASYPEREMADEEVKKMKKLGYAAFIVSTDLADKGVWYRVRLGSFTNKASADRLAGQLRAKEGLQPLVTTE